MPSRAALYVRQSHTTEASVSIDLQVDVGHQTAARFDMPIVHELTEPAATSAYKNRGRNRKQYKVLLELIRTGEVDCVITYLTDRLSRGGSVGYAPLLEAVEDAGLDPNQFVLLPGGFISELERGIRAAIDREEAAKTPRTRSGSPVGPTAGGSRSTTPTYPRTHPTSYVAALGLQADVASAGIRPDDIG